MFVTVFEKRESYRAERLAIDFWSSIVAPMSALSIAPRVLAIVVYTLPNFLLFSVRAVRSACEIFFSAYWWRATEALLNLAAPLAAAFLAAAILLSRALMLAFICASTAFALFSMALAVPRAAAALAAAFERFPWRLANCLLALVTIV